MENSSQNNSQKEALTQDIDNDIAWLKKKSHQKLKTEQETREARRIFKRLTSKKQRKYGKKIIENVDEDDEAID
jgi:hypothetical protein